jgi:protein TonB
MSAKAARRLLFYAFAISLLVHVVIVTFVHPPNPNEETVRIATTQVPHYLHIIEETPHPSPPPTPPPKVRTVARTVTLPVLHPPLVVHTARPVVASTSGKAVAVTETPAIVTPSPRPCDAPAAVSASPDPVEIPIEARAQMTNGTARILVHLDTTGAVLETSVTTSSGSPSLDQVAIAMARNASYLPPRARCKAIAGDYTFSARFAPW